MRKVAGLAIGYAVILVGLAASIVINVNEMRVVAKELDEVIISDVKTIAAYNLTVQQFVTEAQSYLQTGDSGEYEESAEMLAELEALIGVLNESDATYEGFYDAMVIEQHKALKQAATAILSMSQRLYADLPSHPEDLAPDQREPFYASFETIEEAREAFTEQTNQHLALIRGIARQQIDKSLTFTFAGIALALVGMVALTGGALWAMQRWVVQPLRAVTAAADLLSAGQLHDELKVTSNDEIGLLQQTFNRMAATIRQQTAALESNYREMARARDEMEAANRRMSEQLTLIDQQQQMIRELSVPVLPVRLDTLVMPLIGGLDAVRLAQAREQALTKVAASGARRLLLDVTGVPVIDNDTAQGLIQIMHAVRLLGAEVSLIGIRPEVAQSIVSLGISLNGVRTYSDLQHALLQTKNSL
ncbi:STAS domain-containing protein [Chloroflexus islandicus]|nr:STAS domain-containing protein [Chloroflexus islandicus]